MSSIIVFIILVFFVAFLESIFHAAGLISVALISTVLVTENNKTWLAVLFVVVLSLILDSAYFNLLGTFYFAVMITVIVHQALKRLLPYDNILLRIPILFISFFLFHLSLFYISKFGGQGSSFSPELVDMFLRTLVEVVAYSLISSLFNRFYNQNVTSGRVKL